MYRTLLLATVSLLLGSQVFGQDPPPQPQRPVALPAVETAVETAVGQPCETCAPVAPSEPCETCAPMDVCYEDASHCCTGCSDCTCADCCGSCYGKKWGSIFDAQFKPGTRIFGGGDLMVPLWQDSKTLMFFDARGWFSDLETEEYNLGVVVRKQIDCNYIVGAYAFYDIKNSEYDNNYYGGSIGA